MRSGEAEVSELGELGARCAPSYGHAPHAGAAWTRSATPQHRHLARHSRSQQDNRYPGSYEAEDARARRPGLYYSPPGTSYTIVERPASSHGHHPPYSQHLYQAKLTRGHLGSTGTFNTAGATTTLRNSSNHISANGKKRPISPEQVLRLFGQGGAAALANKGVLPSHPVPAASVRRQSPASSPGSTTHHACYRPEPRPYSSGGASSLPCGMGGSGAGCGTGTATTTGAGGAAAGGDATPATRTVTMSRDPPDASHGFGICVKGGKEAGVGVYISRVEEGSVAERAGLRPGDSILQVNGTPFTGISHEDALKMLKSCRQLTMTVRTAGALALGPRATCSWMDRYGRPASPPPPAAILPPPASSRLHPSRSASKDRSIRRVDLCIEPGQSLGLMIRGGLEYNLGIYITGVDKDSVADRAGLMSGYNVLDVKHVEHYTLFRAVTADAELRASVVAVQVGDQILEVNGQSFVEVTHDEAVAQLKYHKRMSLLVRDVGKVPHACTAYGERDPVSPRTSSGGWGKRRGAAASAVEQKARSLLAACELPALAYYMEEYASRRMPPDAFLTVVRDLLDTPQKYSLLIEIREFLLPEDRPRFDELIYRRDLQHEREELNHHPNNKRVGSAPGERHLLGSSTMHELHDPDTGAEAPPLLLEHRSPSEDSGLGLPPHEHYRDVRSSAGGGGRGNAWSRGGDPPLATHPDDLDPHQQEYEEEDRHSRRHSSPCNSREGSTTGLHTQHYDDSELAHKLSRSFDMKEEGGALLEDGSGGPGMRRHQSMQRLQHGDSALDDTRAAKVVSDHHGNLHITVKKTKPILGIAIEGGANTKHPLPRIINIHEHGAAHEAGGLEVGQLILAVDGRRVEGLQHQDVARLIAESFAQRDKPEIEFLVVEAKKSNLEPKPTALIFLEA